MSNILEVKNLTKKYRDGSIEVTALDDINFTIPNGFDIAVLGPSGSGKTTLLQVASGLDYMTSGEIKIQGKNIKKMKDKELSNFRNKTMGFIFQMINLHDFFTAKENVMLPILINGQKKEEAEGRALELLKKVGLSKRADHLPKQLSGGEQQRVAIARALANDPKIIFADEPTGKLDKKNSEIVINILEEIAKEKGMSLVIITHDEKLAKRMSKVIKLESGKII